MWQLADLQKLRFEKSSRFLKSVLPSCQALLKQNETSQILVNLKRIKNTM